MLTLHCDNQRCRDVLLYVQTPCNRTTLIVLSLLSLLLIGGGFYGHFVNPVMWGSYAIIGVGGAGALTVLVALALKLVKIEESFITYHQISSQRSEKELALPALPRVRLNIRNFENAMEQGPLHRELRAISFDLLECVKDLINTALVCRSFYNEVFSENFRKKLEQLSIHLNVFLRTTSPVQTIFGKILDSIPMVDDVDKNPLLWQDRADWPFDQKQCRDLLPIFEREQSPIIKGFFSKDRLFIAIRYKAVEQGKECPENGVFVFFQYSAHSHEEWQNTQAFFKEAPGRGYPMRLSSGCLSEDSQDEFTINALRNLVQSGSVDGFKLWQPEPIFQD